MKKIIPIICLCLIINCIRPLPPRVCIDESPDSSSVFVNIPDDWKSPSGQQQRPSISFKDPVRAARLCWLSYLPDDSIRAFDSTNIYIKTVGDVPIDIGGMPKFLRGIKFFIWYDTTNNRQFVVIRGTCNPATIIADLIYPKILDDSLGIWVHLGFYTVTRLLINEIRDSLRPGYETWLTGHSLGGAVAVLTAFYFKKEGRKLGPVFTFGQPKLLAEEGALEPRYRCFPLIRFVNAGDPVPGTPPSLKEKCPNKLHPGCNGTFRHIGDEVVLNNDDACTYLTRHIPEQSGIKGLLAFVEALDHEKLKDFLMLHLPNKYSSRMQLFKDLHSDSCVFCK